MKKKLYTDDDVKDWIHWYTIDKKSLTTIEKEAKICRQTISRVLKENGINIVNTWNETKFNKNVFDCIDTEEKAYWLGFIYADGYIASQNNSNKNHYTFELSLKGEDFEHLYKFQSFIALREDRVKLSTVNCCGKKFQRCRLCVTNKHLWTVLNNYGCTPCKSLTLQFPSLSIFASKDLIKDFIRGYFDGDGCFSQHKCIKTVFPVISMLGTPEFLSVVQEFLVNYNIESYQTHDKRRGPQTNTLDFRKDAAIKFINLIYSKATVYLDRKYQKYQFFKNGSRSIQEWIE